MIVLSHLTLLSISQKTSDSITCVPNSKLRKAIKEIEDCKIVKEELAATQGSVTILENQINIKDNIINKYDKKDSLFRENVKNLESVVILKDKEILNHKAILAIQNIKIQTLKINKWLYAGGGFFIGVLGFLIFK